MKKTKRKTGTGKTKKTRRRRSAARKPMDLGEIRKKITDLVGSGAEEMVQAAMEEANKGHYAAMKYLFEMAGLYPLPGQAQAEEPEEDCLAMTLWKRLGLPEAALVEEEEKDSSGEAVMAGNEAVE